MEEVLETTTEQYQFDNGTTPNARDTLDETVQDFNTNNNDDPQDVSSTEQEEGQPQEQQQEGQTPNPNQQAEDIQTRVNQHEKALNAVRKDLRNKGVDLNQAVKEYSTYGALSSKTMADLAQAGYPKEVIEGFIANQQILENHFTQEVYKSVGGEKEYNNIVQWAGANLPKSTLDAFNRAIDGNNLEAIKLMLDGMQARRTKAMGTRNPSVLRGAASTGRATSTKGFANQQEMIKAMSDPRYTSDRLYNQEVVKKLLNSPNIFR